MTTKRTIYPASDLLGDWNRSRPIALDGETYTMPHILGVRYAAYDQRDGLAIASQPGKLSLPEIQNPPSQIEFIGVAATGFDPNATGTKTITLPSEPILAGDLIEVKITTQEASGADPGDPTMPAPWQVRSSEFSPGAYLPHVTTFWRYADGGEEGDNVLVTLGASVYSQGMSRVWRGVDQDFPYGIDAPVPVFGNQGTYPNPGPVTVEDDGSVVLADVFGNYIEQTPPANASSGYTVTINQATFHEKAFVCCHKTVGAGQANPGAYSWDVQNWTAVTDVLKPGGSSVVVIVVAAVTDNLETGSLANDDAGIALRHEVQRLEAQSGLGSFTLTWQGQTTASLPANASGAQVQTALEGLALIGSGDVVVNGGTLDLAPIDVQFVGTYAGSPQPPLTASSSALKITELAPGSAFSGFTLEETAEVPRTASAYGPQIHWWAERVSSYKAGKILALKVSTHDTNQSWAAMCMVVENNVAISPGGNTGSDESNAIEVWSADKTGTSQEATYQPITITTNGARIVSFAAKASTAQAAWYNDGVETPSAPRNPAKYSTIASVKGDAITLASFMSAPVPPGVHTPGASNWSSGNERWTTKSMAIAPAIPPAAGASIALALDDESNSEWVEIAGVVGQMYEVVELDMSGIPADAIVLGGRIEVAHESSVRNTLRAVLVGIDDAGQIHPCSEWEPGYQPTPLNSISVIQTPQWVETEDGQPIYEFSRFGIALFSSRAHPDVQSHRIYWARAELEYEEGGPVVDLVTGPVQQGDPITWEFSSASGLPQVGFQAIMYPGAGQPVAGTRPAFNVLRAIDQEIVVDSGFVPSGTARQWYSDQPIGRGPGTTAVRTWVRLRNGLLYASDWTIDVHNVGNVEANPPTRISHRFRPDLGTVEFSFQASTGATRAWLLRSIDEGLSWEMSKASPHEIVPAEGNVIHDDYAPHNQRDVRYQIAVDKGRMNETSQSVDVYLPGGQTLAIPGIGWYLMALGSPEKNMRLDVASVQISTDRNSVFADEHGASVVATGPEGPAEIRVGIRTITGKDRAAVQALLDHDGPLRLVDVLGRDWVCVPVTGRSVEMLRAAPSDDEITTLRDANVTTVTFREVADQ